MDGKAYRRNEWRWKIKAQIILNKETKSRRGKGKNRKETVSIIEKTQTLNWRNHGKVRWKTLLITQEKNIIWLQNSVTRTLLCQTCPYHAWSRVKV